MRACDVRAENSPAAGFQASNPAPPPSPHSPRRELGALPGRPSVRCRLSGALLAVTRTDATGGGRVAAGRAAPWGRWNDRGSSLPVRGGGATSAGARIGHVERAPGVPAASSTPYKLIKTATATRVWRVCPPCHLDGIHAEGSRVEAAFSAQPENLGCSGTGSHLPRRFRRHFKTKSRLERCNRAQSTDSRGFTCADLQTRTIERRLAKPGRVRCDGGALGFKFTLCLLNNYSIIILLTDSI